MKKFDVRDKSKILLVKRKQRNSVIPRRRRNNGIRDFEPMRKIIILHQETGVIHNVLFLQIAPRLQYQRKERHRQGNHLF